MTTKQLDNYGALAASSVRLPGWVLLDPFGVLIKFESKSIKLCEQLTF